MWSVVLAMVAGRRLCFLFEWYGDHRDLHVLTHSFPTRRSSDLATVGREEIGGVPLLDVLREHEDADAGPAAADLQRGTEPFVGVMRRSEEHTSELQSLMRISYAVFCLKKKKKRLDILSHKEARH